MTDKEKLDAIRAEIHRLVDVKGYDREMANDLFAFMNSLPNEPVSDELEEACDSYYDETWDEHGGRAMVVDGCHDIWFPSLATDDFFKAGAQWQKEQIMKDATEVTVHTDAGGYPYIPQMELYDYDNDVPLAKEGDKYKVVLIKEE